MHKQIILGMSLLLCAGDAHAHELGIQSDSKLVDTKQMIKLHQHGLPFLMDGDHYPITKTCENNKRAGVFLLVGTETDQVLNKKPNIKAWTTPDGKREVTVHIQPAMIGHALNVALPIEGCNASFSVRQVKSNLIEVSGISKSQCLNLIHNLVHQHPGMRPQIYGGLCIQGDNNRVRFPGHLDGK